MTNHLNGVEFSIFVILFLIVTLVGFAAVRWRRADNLLHLNEWGLGGRSFGTFITWFLLGGDLYTAYTFIAVPALVFGVGSTGFFAVPYTIMVFPIVFIFMPRLWSVSHVHGYVTPADFVRGRYGSRGLSLAVALTGILATMPYIALQLVGIQVVLDVMGVGGSASANTFVKDLPLFIAFVLLASYTYVSGLRAPALIAFIKDTLIYVVVIVAVIYIPIKIGGWGHIFGVADAHLKSVNPKTGKPFGSLITPPAGQWAYATLALGSALALFMYPHAVTGTLAAKSRETIRRNMALLPTYSLMLGLIALFGYMALATKGVPAQVKAAGNTQLAVPLLFNATFPSWFAGVAFSAVAIGALVPAAIMSIAAANLFTRNVFVEFIKPDAAPELQARVSQLTSLIVKAGALVFVLALSKSFAINLQLLGGIWILQTFPTIVAGLYTRWFHRWALLIGWAVAMVYGTVQAYRVPVPGTLGSHFGGSTAPIPFFGQNGYIALTAFAINLIVAVVLTLIFRTVKLPAGTDETAAHHYVADAGEPTVHEIPELVEGRTAAGPEGGA
jgi:SSS family solute:Na+ symporter